MPPTTRSTDFAHEGNLAVKSAGEDPHSPCKMGKMKETVDLVTSSVVAEFEVLGKPQTQPRPRFNRATGRAYKARRATASEKAFQEAVKKFHRRTNFTALPADSDVVLHLEFHLARPKSHYQGNKFGNPLKPNATRLARMGGDLDNFVKFTMDALNGIIYQDDKQVIALHAKKVIADEGIAKTVVKAISDCAGL